MKLAWSTRAEAELRDIRTYSVERWGRCIATDYLRAIHSAAKHAATGKVQLRPLREGFWSLRVRSHLLIIQINEPETEIMVVRILHSAMDIERHLPPPLGD